MESPSARDDALILSGLFGNGESGALRFGLAGREGRDFTELARAASASNSGGHVVFRYQDPARPRDATFFSFADEGYRVAFPYASGAKNLYYLQALPGADANDEYVRRHVAPNVLYLASGLAPTDDDPPGAADHAAYLESYARALAELNAGRAGRALGNEIVAMERLVGDRTPPDSDLSTFRKLYAMESGSYSPLRDTGYVGKVALLEALAASDYGRFAGALREESEIGVRDDAGARANLQAIFWTMRREIGIPDVEADAYRRDLVSTGEAVSPALLASLSDGDRNLLLANYLVGRLGAADVKVERVPRGDGEDTVLFWGAGAQAWLSRHMPRDLVDRLEKEGVGGKNRCILAFSDPPESTGLFSAVHALSLEADSITACADATAWLRFDPRPERQPYASLECADGSFRANGRAFRKTGPLAPALSRLRDAFQSADYGRDELMRFVKGDLAKALAASLERPDLRR